MALKSNDGGQVDWCEKKYPLKSQFYLNIVKIYSEFRIILFNSSHQVRVICKNYLYVILI